MTDTTHAAKLVLYPASVISVHDGDTFRVTLPMDALIPGVTAAYGSWVEDIRLAHVNAAELSTADGIAAKQAVIAWIAQSPLAIRLFAWGRDKYGRLLADLQRDSDGELLSVYVASLAGSKPELIARQLAS